jgi:formylglycine-generating enzyme
LASGKYTHGPTENNITDNAVFNQNSGNKTANVGTKKPIFVNGKAIYDIAGNIWKWVSDLHGILQGGVNPQGASTGSFRVFRGGGFYISAADMRSGNRAGFLPVFLYFNLGFRLASDSQ